MPTRSRSDLAKHRRLTEARARAYKKVFGRAPAKTYKSDYFEGDGELPPVDIFIYEFAAGDQAVYAAVTSGMSDLERSDSGRELTGRRELIQYFETINEDWIRRLYDMAWVPLHDGFAIDEGDTVTWPKPVYDTRFPSGFFIPSLIGEHREFSFRVDGDSTCFLWHVPISEAELAHKKKHGAGALLELMKKNRRPWIFAE